MRKPNSVGNLILDVLLIGMASALFVLGAIICHKLFS